MSISIKHKFTSEKQDGPDSSQIQPSNWNDEHDIELSAKRILGRFATTSGSVQEIQIGTGLELNDSGSLVSTVDSSSYTIQKDGVSFDNRTNLNFTGLGITLTENTASDSIDISLSFGSGSAITNLTIQNVTTSSLQIASDTGTDITLNAATATSAGLFSAEDKIKLDNIEPSASTDLTAGEITASIDTTLGHTNWKTNLTSDATGIAGAIEATNIVIIGNDAFAALEASGSVDPFTVYYKVSGSVI